jgi:hypothetical protein
MTRIRQQAADFAEEVLIGGRSARKKKELEIVRNILATTTNRRERLRLWKEQTRK